MTKFAWFTEGGQLVSESGLDRLNWRDEEIFSSSTDYMLHQEVNGLIRVTWNKPQSRAGAPMQLTDEGVCSRRRNILPKKEIWVICPGRLNKAETSFEVRLIGNEGKATFLGRFVVCSLLSGDFGAVGDSRSNYEVLGVPDGKVPPRICFADVG